ncbi:ATP-dependent Clp protease adapter ClpS [bacterium]|nr:ATP-dependent Clp protease adapter ClpS [bacterium]
MGQSSGGNQSDLLTKSRGRIKHPSLYRVVLLNDDYTTMDFVVSILIEIFGKSASEATAIMLDVHEMGRGVVGTFPFDIAKTKIIMVEKRAQSEQFPLKCVMEKI